MNIDKRTIIDVLLELIEQVRKDPKPYYKDYLKASILLLEGIFNISIVSHPKLYK